MNTMKTLGLIGGMSAESTVSYYQIINREINRRLGGNHSARLVMHSVDFEEVVRWRLGRCRRAAGALRARFAAHRSRRTGVVHQYHAQSSSGHSGRRSHSAAARGRCHGGGRSGTGAAQRGTARHSLYHDDGFYHRRMAQHGIELQTPDAATQDAVHRIIFEELCVGRI